MLLELGREHPSVLHWDINVENISLHDLSSNHRLVNRHSDLFPSTSLSHIFSLVLDPDDLPDPPSTTVDQWILRLDDPIKHFNPDDSRITTAKHETLQQLDLSRPYQKVHLRLRTRQPLNINPARILLQDMIEDIPFEDWNLR